MVLSIILRPVTDPGDGIYLYLSGALEAPASEDLGLADSCDASVSGGTTYDVAAREAMGLQDGPAVQAPAAPPTTTSGAGPTRRRPAAEASGTFALEAGHRQLIRSRQTDQWALEASHRQVGVGVAPATVPASRGPTATGQFAVEASHKQGFF